MVHPRLFVALCVLSLAGCPSADDDDLFGDDDDLVGVDDDDATANDDDATANDDDATANDDDATADDDDATADDDDATADDDDATMTGPGGPVMFLTGISCGFSVNSQNAGFNNNAWGYPACGLGMSGWDAGEYVVTVGQAGGVTLNLTWSDASKDLDLIVLSGGDVTTSTCWGSSTASTGTSESVSFTLASGEVAWVVIDGKNGDETSFDLSVSCP